MEKPVFDPRDPAFRSDPYALYERFRAYGPIFDNPDGSGVVCSHEAVSKLMADRNRVRSIPLTEQPFGAGPLMDFNSNIMNFKEGADHLRIRTALGNAFVPKALAAMEEAIRSVCTELLTGLEQMESFDFATDFATLYPLYVVCELLGVPRDEWELYRTGANDVTLAEETIAEAPGSHPAMLADADRAAEALRRSLEQNIASRGDTTRTDIISLLLAHEETARISHDELIHNLIFLLLAGHETTSTLLNNAMQFFFEQPELVARLRKEPGMIPNSIEEMLRLRPSLQFVIRYAAEPIEWGDIRIAAGKPLFMLLGSANRDPERFPDPDALQVDRPNSARHLSFAFGPHTCLGNNLARMETRIALKQILDRMPDLQPNGRAEPSSHVLFQGFTSLPVRRGRQVVTA